MKQKSRLPKRYIDAYWSEVEGILVSKHKVSQPVAHQAIKAFRDRFGKRADITLYNTDPSEIAETIAEQERTQDASQPLVPEAS